MGRFLLCVESDVREVNSLLAFHNVHPQVRADVQRRLERLVYRVYEHVTTLKPGYGESPHDVCAVIVKDVVHNTLQNVIPLVQLAAEERQTAELQQRTRDIAAELQVSERRCEELQGSLERFRKAHEYMLSCYFREVLLLRYQLREAMLKRRETQTSVSISQMVQPISQTAQPISQTLQATTVMSEPKIVDVVKGAPAASTLRTMAISDLSRDGYVSSGSALATDVVVDSLPSTTNVSAAATGASFTSSAVTAVATTRLPTFGLQMLVTTETGRVGTVLPPSEVGGKVASTTIYGAEEVNAARRKKDVRCLKTTGTQTAHGTRDDSVDAIFDYDDYVQQLQFRKRRRGETASPDRANLAAAEKAAMEKRRREELSSLRLLKRQLLRKHEDTIASLKASLWERRGSGGSSSWRLTAAVEPIKEELLEELGAIFRGVRQMREQHYEDMALLKEAVKVVQARVDQLLLFLTHYADEVGSIAAQLTMDDVTLEASKTDTPFRDDDLYQRRVVLDFFAVQSQSTTSATSSTSSSTPPPPSSYESTSSRSAPATRLSLSASIRDIDVIPVDEKSGDQTRKKKKKKNRNHDTEAETEGGAGGMIPNVDFHLGFGNDTPTSARRYWADNAVTIQATQAFAALQAAALKLRRKASLRRQQQQQQGDRQITGDTPRTSAVDFFPFHNATSDAMESISSFFDGGEGQMFTSCSREEMLRALVQLRMKRIAARARYRTELRRLKEAAESGGDTASMQEILYRAWQHEQTVRTITRLIDRLTRLLDHPTSTVSDQHTFFTKNLALSPYLNEPWDTWGNEEDVQYVPVPVKAEHADELYASLVSNQPGHIVFNGEIIPIATVVYSNREGRPLRGRSAEFPRGGGRDGRRRMIPFHGTVIDYYRGVQLGRPLVDYHRPFPVIWEPAIDSFFREGNVNIGRLPTQQQPQQVHQRNVQLTTVLMPWPLPEAEEREPPMRVAPPTIVAPRKPTQEVRPPHTTALPLTETIPAAVTCAPPLISPLPPCSQAVSAKDRVVRLAVIQPKKEDLNLMRIESLSARRVAGGAVGGIPKAAPPVKRATTTTTTSTTSALSRLRNKQQKQRQQQEGEEVREVQGKELPVLHWPPYVVDSSSMTGENFMRMRFPRLIPVSPTPSE